MLAKFFNLFENDNRRCIKFKLKRSTKGGLTMFENLLFVLALIGLVIFQITSIISLKSELKKYISLSEEKSEKFELFYESLEDNRKSPMVDKKGD
jgi:hypothetical protein